MGVRTPAPPVWCPPAIPIVRRPGSPADRPRDRVGLSSERARAGAICSAVGRGRGLSCRQRTRPENGLARVRVARVPTMVAVVGMLRSTSHPNTCPAGRHDRGGRISPGAAPADEGPAVFRLAPMKVLVAGAHGRLGSRVVALLLARGYKVRALVRTDGQAAALREVGAEAVVADLRRDVEWT